MAALLGVLLAGAGCSNLPEAKITEHSVFRAAREVIAERFPRHAVSEQNGFLYALSPVAMEGSSKTRKQISVVIKRDYTGSYDADVQVTQFAEVGEPYLSADPESDEVVFAKPLRTNKWKPLTNLPYEAQSIYDAIQQKLEPRGI